MKPEKHDTAIGEKWQLYLPTKIEDKFANQAEVVIALTADGCLGIYPVGWRTFFSGYRVALRRGQKSNCARITIPSEFRNSTSFFYGPTITLVCKRGHVEIWPRPSWSGEERKIGRPPSRHVLRLTV